MKKLFSLLTAAACAALATPTLHADTVAFTTSGDNNVIQAVDYSIGYTFSLASTIQVTQLGFWDYAGDGLGVAIPVTIWNSNGTAVATATVPAGTNAGELNRYLYVQLAIPVALTAGAYTIAGYTQSVGSSGRGDYVQFSQSTITPAAGISYGRPRFDRGTGVPNTDVIAYGNAYFGPNFQSVVPEPSTWALLGVGLAAVSLAARRRRARLL